MLENVLSAMCLRLEIDPAVPKKWHGSIGSHLRSEELAPRRLKKIIGSVLCFCVTLIVWCVGLRVELLWAAPLGALLSGAIFWGGGDALWLLNGQLKEKAPFLKSIKRALLLGVISTGYAVLIGSIVLLAFTAIPCLALLYSPIYRGHNGYRWYPRGWSWHHLSMGFKQINEDLMRAIVIRVTPYLQNNERRTKLAIKKSASEQIISQYLYEWAWEGLGVSLLYSNIRCDEQEMEQYFDLAKSHQVNWEYSPLDGMPLLMEVSRQWLRSLLYEEKVLTQYETQLTGLIVAAQSRQIGMNVSCQQNRVDKKVFAL